MSLISIQEQNKAIHDNNGHLIEDVFRGILSDAGYDSGYIYYLILCYRKFKSEYPILIDWFSEDLQVRAGINKKRNLCFHNRIYIFILALYGLKLDYDYLFSLIGMDGLTRLCNRLNINLGINVLSETAAKIGYSEYSSSQSIQWAYYRILLHTAKGYYSQVTIQDIKEFRQMVNEFCADEMKIRHWSGKYKNHDLKDRFTGSLYRLHKVLYVLNIVGEEPKKEHSRVKKIDRDLKQVKNQQIASTIVRYYRQCRNIKEEGTIQNSFSAIYKFITWFEIKYPEVTSLSQVNRNIIESYMNYLKENGSDRDGKAFSINTLVGYLSPLKVFFDETLAWDYEDVPQKKIMFGYDIPKRPASLPRYIPEQDLMRLMEAVKDLECQYQRNALILLRWTGARREEIQRLEINALDYYSDGTPKILIPIGKTNRSRWVPVNKEAETAFKTLLKLRECTGNIKGLIDRKTKKVTDYLFMRKNERISASYLFQTSLWTACSKAGLMTNEGKPKYSSHQFRHTIGTTMANRGASLPTIMKMLGHESPEMSLVYTTIFDETVKEEYEKSIMNNKRIAGGAYAVSLKEKQLDKDEVDWIKANFHKTYLVMGHCFHHIKEPMCEFADACFFCSKFVTTTEHIPLLKEKYETELQLITDAKDRNWDREIQRHERVSDRIKDILKDLGVCL